ncbi:MAG: tRNA (pseudouridine(54)-N(1))-methyltransferase TrmY [Archaeoglobaceae archaeon]
MRAFLVVGNKAVTKPFNLNDLPGAAGRMDIMCRCVAQALFYSHGVRKDTEIYLLLLGGEPSKALRINGGEVKYMSPDERNIAGLLRKALQNEKEEWKRSTPGIYSAVKTFEELLNELSHHYNIFYLREDGQDIRQAAPQLQNTLFVMGDHLGLSDGMEEKLFSYTDKVVFLSPILLQADQCILITHYELDRVDTGKV